MIATFILQVYKRYQKRGVAKSAADESACCRAIPSDNGLQVEGLCGGAAISLLDAVEKLRHIAHMPVGRVYKRELETQPIMTRRSPAPLAISIPASRRSL
jgi:hypothetical protein